MAPPADYQCNVWQLKQHTFQVFSKLSRTARFLSCSSSSAFCTTSGLMFLIRPDNITPSLMTYPWIAGVSRVRAATIPSRHSSPAVCSRSPGTATMCDTRPMTLARPLMQLSTWELSVRAVTGKPCMATAACMTDSTLSCMPDVAEDPGCEVSAAG